MANSSLPLLVAFAGFGGLALADNLTDSSPVRWATAAAAGAFSILLVTLARFELRTWGARRWVLSAVWILPVLCILAEAERVLNLLDTSNVHVALRLVGWIGLLTAWLAPETTVEATGGPRPEWAVVRERSMLWLAVNSLPVERRTVASEGVAPRIRALDRFRTPATAEYIDLYQRLALGVIPAADAGPAWARLDALHQALVASFGAPPAWASAYARDAAALEQARASQLDEARR